ncbi:hypothetical protein L1049_007003 [Liquidambar formosana]|uniref:Uncharacterized protein n=1 Tax=Liquidambar formosana TaxID=63359 RepID=A0AAP0RGF0_LIQFO
MGKHRFTPSALLHPAIRVLARRPPHSSIRRSPPSAVNRMGIPFAKQNIHERGIIASPRTLVRGIFIS